MSGVGAGKFKTLLILEQFSKSLKNQSQSFIFCFRRKIQFCYWCMVVSVLNYVNKKSLLNATGQVNVLELIWSDSKYTLK